MAVVVNTMIEESSVMYLTLEKRQAEITNKKAASLRL